ncbi:hypothetical protein LTR53_015757, partial [Teratosphaeriaceae sp. CCFEE 6253]
MGTISPPPPKRRKLPRSPDSASHHPPTCVSIFSHNVNGLTPYLQPPITTFFKPSEGTPGPGVVPKASLRDFLRRHDFPTMLLLQEIKIGPDDSVMIRALQRAVASAEVEVDGPDYIVHLCLPSDRYNARGFGRKIYGVASIIRRDWYDEFVREVRPVTWDTEGRFLVVETHPIGPRPLAIINIYAVNGTNLPYKDPASGAPIGTRHDRKLQ